VAREAVVMKEHTRSFSARVSCLLLACLAVGGSAGCGRSSGGDGGEQSEGSTLTLLAASSLTDAFGELEGVFEEQNGGVDVSTSFAGSSELLAQIRQGAPADVFASADEAKTDAAMEEGLVAEPEVFARNRPAVIVPADNPAGIEELRDLEEADAQIVLAEEAVPIARYAEKVLDNADAEYRGGFVQRVRDKIASREANVRASANRIALGEADATIVYESDVTEDIRDRVRVVEMSLELNVVAMYPIATIEESRNPELARAWVDLVLSDEGQRVLEKYNFEPVGRS
jgi:molybdate transport system substrate-binding protein